MIGLDPRPRQRRAPLYSVDRQCEPITGPAAGLLGLLLFGAACGAAIWWAL